MADPDDNPIAAKLRDERSWLIGNQIIHFLMASQKQFSALRPRQLADDDEEAHTRLHQNLECTRRVANATVSSDRDPASIAYDGEPLFVGRERCEMIVVPFYCEPRRFK